MKKIIITMSAELAGQAKAMFGKDDISEFTVTAALTRAAVTKAAEPNVTDGTMLTVKMPAALVSAIRAHKAESRSTTSQILVAAVARYFDVLPPQRAAGSGPGEFQIQLSFNREQRKILDRAVKTAKITRSEFIRRALADAVRLETN